MKKTELISLIKECYNEVLLERKKTPDVKKEEPKSEKKSDDKTSKAIEKATKELTKAHGGNAKKGKEELAKSAAKAIKKRVVNENEENLVNDPKINMGDEHTNIELTQDKKATKEIDALTSKYSAIKAKLQPYINDFKDGKISKEEYIKSTSSFVKELKQTKQDLENLLSKI